MPFGLVEAIPSNYFERSKMRFFMKPLAGNRNNKCASNGNNMHQIIRGSSIIGMDTIRTDTEVTLIQNSICYVWDNSRPLEVLARFQLYFLD